MSKNSLTSSKFATGRFVAPRMLVTLRAGGWRSSTIDERTSGEYRNPCLCSFEASRSGARPSQHWPPRDASNQASHNSFANSFRSIL